MSRLLTSSVLTIFNEQVRCRRAAQPHRPPRRARPRPSGATALYRLIIDSVQRRGLVSELSYELLSGQQLP